MQEIIMSRILILAYSHSPFTNIALAFKRWIAFSFLRCCLFYYYYYYFKPIIPWKSNESHQQKTNELKRKEFLIKTNKETNQINIIEWHLLTRGCIYRITNNPKLQANYSFFFCFSSQPGFFQTFSNNIICNEKYYTRSI